MTRRSRSKQGPGGPRSCGATEVDRDRGLEATSATTDQVALEALGLLQLAGYPRIARAETAPGWTTWERCLSKPVGPEAGRSLLQRFTRRHGDQCAFSTLPKEHPIGSLRWPQTHHATLDPSRSSGESVPTSWARRPPERPGLPLSPRRHARPRAGDPQADQLRPRNWICRSRSQVLTEVSLARQSGRCPPKWAADDAVSGLTGRMSIQR